MTNSRRRTAALIAVCAIAAVLHLGPYIIATIATPDGWTFTGNTHGSPDNMVYRTWMRQSMETGFFVTNKFTEEPNPPHIPVGEFWIFGKIAQVTGVRSETVYEIGGSVLAAVLTWLVWLVLAKFGRSRIEKLWMFAIIAVSGGVASHMKLVQAATSVPGTRVLASLVERPLETTSFLEDFRGTYFLKTILDTHFIVVWTMVLMSLLAAHATMRKPRNMSSWAAMLVLFGLTTLVSIYQGVSIIAVMAAVCLVFRIRGHDWRHWLRVLLASLCVVGGVAMWQVFKWKAAGLPLPEWRGPYLLFAVVVVGYPFVFLTAPMGAAHFVKNADMDDSFIAGWAAGLLAIVLSSPFYLYPVRGTVTLAIPLAIIACRVYFRNHRQVSFAHAAVAIVLMIALPVHIAYTWRRDLEFRPDRTYIWINQNHKDVIRYLREHADESDLLLVDRRRAPWQTDDRWLAPAFRGRMYSGNYFLTPNYSAKRGGVIQFYHQMESVTRATFLEQSKIRWVFAGPENDLPTLRNTPGLVLRLSFPEGSLLEYIGS